MTFELSRDERATRVEQIEHLLVRRAIEDARPVPARLDEPDATQRGQVLRRRAGLEPELRLERADRALADADDRVVITTSR